MPSAVRVAPSTHVALKYPQYCGPCIDCCVPATHARCTRTSAITYQARAVPPRAPFVSTPAQPWYPCEYSVMRLGGSAHRTRMTPMIPLLREDRRVLTVPLRVPLRVLTVLLRALTALLRVLTVLMALRAH